MRKTYLATLLATCLLSACGGGGSSTPETPPAAVQPTQPAEPAKPRFARQISFGDSLSDVGTYAVGTVKTLGGGKFTINGGTAETWVEQLARQLSLAAPCAAQTGLDGDAAMGFSVPVTDHTGCFGYAQGGARVTNDVGPTHKSTGSPLGALTVPVAKQVSRHLQRSGGKFQADDLLLVMAGGNDLLFELEVLRAEAEAAGAAAGQRAFDNSLARALATGAPNPDALVAEILAAMASQRAIAGSSNEQVIAAGVGVAIFGTGNLDLLDAAVVAAMVQQAVADGEGAGKAAVPVYILGQVPTLVGAMVKAGTELAALVKNQMLANGAQYVVVNNLPDVAATPTGRALDAAVQPLVKAMAEAFNEQLRIDLANEPRVLLVDAYALTQEAAANPAAFGLTNVTDTACDLSVEKNRLQSSLACNASNLKPGDVSRYAYADGEHPTPFFYNVLTNRVLEEMKKKGWN